MDNMYDLQYDTPVEVNERQYHVVRNKFGGIASHRYDDETGKYYIKLWYMSYKNRVEQYLIENR